MKPSIDHYWASCCRTWQKSTDLCCARRWIKGEDVGNHTVREAETEIQIPERDK